MKFGLPKLVLTGLLALTASACAHGQIPGTEIEDTEENRQILDLVNEYRSAVERLDAPAVMALVSPHFYENHGNIDASDDYDYNGLERNLTANFERTERIQLLVRVDDIQVEEDSAFAEVYYQLRAQNRFPAGTKWQTGSDRTRLRFERVDDTWKIVAGL